MPKVEGKESPLSVLPSSNPMASHRSTIFSLFTFLILFVCVSSASSNPALFSSALSLHSDEKVSLGLYYESLCPFCANFIVNYLANIFDNGLIDITDLNLVPWGNAKLRSDGSIACQHGPAECLLNTVEACAINLWPDLNQHFPFIYCIEKLAHKGDYGQWETCYAMLGLDPAPVSDCMSGGYGKELELQYAAETNALQPPHRYVPWVVVDGQPLYDDYENFINYVCKAYKGKSVPKVCSQASLNWKDKVTPAVWPTEEKTSALSRIGMAIRSKIHEVSMAD